MLSCLSATAPIMLYDTSVGVENSKDARKPDFAGPRRLNDPRASASLYGDHLGGDFMVN